MKLLVKFMLLWGICDSILLAAKPKLWGRFWQRGVEKISDNDRLAQSLAALQVTLCLFFWRKI
jgi:hypothetical protein